MDLKQDYARTKGALMWNKLWNWYSKNPKNRFWVAIGVIGVILIHLEMTCTAPNFITWVAILVNASAAVVNMYDWLTLQRGSKS